MSDKKRSSRTPLWTYAYQIDPPQVEDRLRSLRKLLDDEHAQARRGARTWAGRVITEERMTHILVVSDSPEQSRKANSRLEAELKKLHVGFSITAPMEIADDAARSPPGESDPD